VILAVDGGASKADVVLVARNGHLVGAARLQAYSHFGLDHEMPVEALEEAVQLACRDGGVDSTARPLADTGVFCVAGADLPVDDRRIGKELKGIGWTRQVMIRNDTFAVLRAGTDRGWGVAVVCGAGLNCSAVGPDGRTVRFPALGEQSGDMAHGGGWLGRAALGAAIRARDGRGPRTMLEKLVPAHFAMSRPTAVMEAAYTGKLDYLRMLELPPIVFQAAADGDGVARNLIDQVADEIVANVAAAIRRLRIASRDPEVILGGGVFRSRDRRMLKRILEGVAAVAPRAHVRRLDAPPVLGAALLGLDAVKAPKGAHEQLRKELTSARLKARTKKR
jgi:N-acetylglucosamine kinase-like BadF-type ATPase